MPKDRKTKKEKIRAEKRKIESQQFSIKNEWLKVEPKKANEIITLAPEDRKFLRLDLTKTFFLTMLVLALELALWQYLSRH